MIAIPAIDLRDGACVQLVGGVYAEQRVRVDHALGVARSWAAAGFQRLHVVDLDAATGRGTNRDLVKRLAGESGVRVQVGGGLRDDTDIADLLAAGADHVILGTRAIADRAWLETMVAAYPGRVIVAADVRQREVVTHGWRQSSARDIGDVTRQLGPLHLAAILVTAVHQEGRLKGPDLPLMESMAGATSHPLYAAGGITTLEDLRALEALGVAGAILGMALYTGALDPRTVAEEFAA